MYQADIAPAVADHPWRHWPRRARLTTFGDVRLQRGGGASLVIERLRAIGLPIAIDEFGSGYSTMSYLRDLHIDELKLDRQFIAPILHSERAVAIVRSVIDLAHTLGFACVAEGVEDVETANRLRDYGCDIAQGHYFCRPLKSEALLDGFSSAAAAVRPSSQSPAEGPATVPSLGQAAILPLQHLA